MKTYAVLKVIANNVCGFTPYVDRMFTTLEAAVAYATLCNEEHDGWEYGVFSMVR